MQDQTPPPPSPLLDFTPVPRKILRRHDGWTADRQRAFIAALAATGSVSAAARRVGVCNASAYNLYNHPEAASLRAAWDRALEIGAGRIHDVAMERALDGVPRAIFYRGEQIGEELRFSDRVLVHLLRYHSFGHHPSPVGHRSLAARERHAAENCPVCRDRREAEAVAAEAAEAAGEAQMTEGQAAAGELLRRYGLKVAAERRHRLAGEVVAADLALRQLTVIEILMEGCGMDALLRACWGEHMDALLSAEPTDFTRELAAVRAEVWAKAGDPPRPALRLEEGAPRQAAMWGGPTIMARQAVQKEAQARIAAAQAEWEAAGSEAGWAAWQAK